ncbi:MAG TPA: hypothetical protein VE972_10510 [Conexibacter sp.]|nr:hypothetical protein [Conexibacter sp.]
MAVLAAERIERPPLLFGDGVESRDGVGGGPTLDDAIVGVWEGLAARVAVACPLCGGGLAPRADGGCCRDCGTSLF